MPTYSNGKESKEKLLEELNCAIKENNGVTSKHNWLLVKYTRWLVGLTIAIGVIATLQLFIMLR